MKWDIALDVGDDDGDRVDAISPTDYKLGELGRFKRDEVIWMVLLPATAECLIAEFLPHATSEVGIDLASTAANTLGAFLEGLLYGVERQSARVETQRLCSMTRGYFMNVFTSFPFVAVHAADMCVLNGPMMGLGYIVTSLALAVTAFELGRRPTEVLLFEARFNPMHWTSRIGTQHSRRRILYGLCAVLIISLLKSKFVLAAAVAIGRDTADQEAHTVETLVGIVMAIAGALLGGLVPSCTWANFLSCMFVGMAFGSRRLLGWDAADASLWTVVFTKFVGSFCGATSGFAKMLSDAGKLMHDELKPRDAVVTIVGNVAIATLWGGVFYASDRQGLDVYSHAFLYTVPGGGTGARA
mmetsp:Transcript_8429/g.21535  ORF Transcript_8429/g.21535 Transcript_8429/m.21535 type:complete len:356 (+) Transcript_8429:373-1440(+)